MGSLAITPGFGANIRVFTAPDGFLMQSINLSDPTTGKTASVTDNGAGQESLNVGGAFKELPGLSAGALNADLVPSTDVSAYKSFSLSIGASGYSGTLAFQGSNDGTIWLPVFANRLDSANVGSSTTAASIIYMGPAVYRYLRVRMTSYTSGSASGTLELYTAAYNPLAILASQGGTWTFGSNSASGSAVPANAHYMAGTDGANLTPLSLRTTGSDGFGTTVPALLALIEQMGFNGTSWDRIRVNEAVSVLTSASRTTTQTSADLLNYNGVSSLDVILDVTSAGSGSITLSIDGKDPASGKYYSLLAGLAVTANSTNRYRVGPFLAAAANSIAQDVLPRTFRITVTANNTNAITYSVGYTLTRG